MGKGRAQNSKIKPDSEGLGREQQAGRMSHRSCLRPQAPQHVWWGDNQVSGGGQARALDREIDAQWAS